MSAISGTKKEGVDPRFYALFVAVAVTLLLASAFSIGVMAAVLVAGHSPAPQKAAETSITSIEKTSTTAKSSTTTTRQSTTSRATTKQSAYDEATTTFLEYTSTTTTLSEANLENDSDCVYPQTYHGPFTCKGKSNLAWFDQWA